MSRTYVPVELRERVRAAARHRCGYCLSAELFSGIPMEIDHLIPESVGGPTEEDNLWLACGLCNEHRGNRTAATDKITGEVVRLFDPRHQTWADHFRWSDTGDVIIGLTPIGRATVEALQLNRAVRVDARRNWVSVGWHPPRD
jgi:HNH endonuclease